MVPADRRIQTEDTDPVAERTQPGLLHKATVARRVAIAVSLSQGVIRLAREAIRRQNPDLADRDVALRFADIHYWPESAEMLLIRLAPIPPLMASLRLLIIRSYVAFGLFADDLRSAPLTRKVILHTSALLAPPICS